MKAWLGLAGGPRMAWFMTPVCSILYGILAWACPPLIASGDDDDPWSASLKFNNSSLVSGDLARSLSTLLFGAALVGRLGDCWVEGAIEDDFTLDPGIARSWKGLVPGVVVGCIFGTAINFLTKVLAWDLLAHRCLTIVYHSQLLKKSARKIADSNKLRMPPFRSNMGYNKAVTVNDPIKCQM